MLSLLFSVIPRVKWTSYQSTARLKPSATAPPKQTIRTKRHELPPRRRPKPSQLSSMESPNQFGFFLQTHNLYDFTIVLAKDRRTDFHILDCTFQFLHYGTDNYNGKKNIKTKKKLSHTCVPDQMLCLQSVVSTLCWLAIEQTNRKTTTATTCLNMERLPDILSCFLLRFNMQPLLHEGLWEKEDVLH